MLLNPYYVTGLAECAGSFTYSRGKGSITLYFGIKSSTKDLPLLLKIKENFGVGKVYRGGRGVKQWAHYRVNKLGDLIKIVAHFEHYPLQGIKQHAFTTWQQMVACKRRKLPKDKEKCHVLAIELSKLK